MGNSRKIGDISNNTFGDNTNLQGDHANLTKINIGNSEKEVAFNELFDFINTIQDVKEKEYAHFHAEELKFAMEKGDTTKAKRLFGFLQSSLGNISALITIGQFVGMPPLPL